MKKIAGLLVSLSLILLASVGSASGQEKQATFEKQVGPIITMQGPGSGADTFIFVNSEFSFDRLVKGAPYSAQANTETTQVLSDGNRIVNSSTAAVYRDGEGRTRREQTLRAIGAFSASGETHKTISINDPVAGVSYVLEPNSRTARKIQGLRVEAAAGAGFKVSSGGDGNVIFNRTPNGEVQIKRSTVEAKVREDKLRNEFHNEDLGTQAIEGVNAVGTRTTITIPAGQIGNERAIEIVDERWFSPELKTVVMTRHSDPRSGEVVYRLTNIIRAEPDHSLFEVPSDYTLRDDQEPVQLRVGKPVPQQ